MTDLLGVHQVL